MEQLTVRRVFTGWISAFGGDNDWRCRIALGVTGDDDLIETPAQRTSGIMNSVFIHVRQRDEYSIEIIIRNLANVRVEL